MKKINIQIWNNHAVVWDDVLATQHEVTNPAEVAQAICDAVGQPVRLTYHVDGIKIGKQNGAYLRPRKDYVDVI